MINIRLFHIQQQENTKSGEKTNQEPAWDKEPSQKLQKKLQ